MIFQDWDLELAGEHVLINSLTEKDSEAYGRLLLGKLYDTLQEITKEAPVPTGFKSILDHTSNDETHAIRLLPDKNLIGWITLQKNKEGDPDIGISIEKKQQNKGYGPEAIQLFCNYLNETYGLQQVKVHISAKNIQSQNAFAKVGAVLDQEIPDERYTRLLAEHPDHKMADGFMMKVRCYHIPLPIGKILPSSHPDEETMRKAQEAYEEEETQLIKEVELTELESLQKKIDSKETSSLEDLRSYLKSRIAELERH